MSFIRPRDMSAQHAVQPRRAEVTSLATSDTGRDVERLGTARYTPLLCRSSLLPQKPLLIILHSDGSPTEYPGTATDVLTWTAQIVDSPLVMFCQALWILSLNQPIAELSSMYLMGRFRTCELVSTL